MGTTTNQGLRYPEPTGRVRVGPADIRALAEDVDAALDWDPGVTITDGESARTCEGAGSYVDFTGVEASLGDFSRVGDSFQYNGAAPRMYLASISVEVLVGNASTPQASLESTVYLRVNNADVRGSTDLVATPGGTLETRKVVHHINVPLILSPGDLVAAWAFGFPGPGGVASIGVCSIRIYPMGPA